jgi:hypothetical protein
LKGKGRKGGRERTKDRVLKREREGGRGKRGRERESQREIKSGGEREREER